jgi:ribosomal RNA-processing protein 12
MISATITALSRLIFEFQGECGPPKGRELKADPWSEDHISRQTMDDLLETVVVFLEAKNREIVKSALGFVKVAVVSLPADTTRSHLKRLVPALLNWVHDHKNHFKTKTVHIFERMIRKYGYDDVYKCAPDGNEKKVLEHIKKKKDRAKRQKAAKATDGAGEEVRYIFSFGEQPC